MQRLMLLVLLGLNLPGCTGLLFQPMRRMVAAPDDLGFDYQDIIITTSDRLRLHAWLIPASQTPRGRILVLHGNAENISTHMRSVLWLSRSGFELLLLDYRGYGRSEGRPTLDGLHRDAAAALQFMLARSANDAKPLFVLGQSLGASIAISTLARYPSAGEVSGLIIDSAVVGYRDIAREKLGDFWLTWPLQYPLAWTVAGQPRALDDIIRLPPLALLFIGGVKDPVVPLHHAEALYRAAPAPKSLWRFHGQGHVTAFASTAVRQQLLQWLDQTLVLPADSAVIRDLP